MFDDYEGLGSGDAAYRYGSSRLPGGGDRTVAVAVRDEPWLLATWLYIALWIVLALIVVVLLSVAWILALAMLLGLIFA